jgi:hypothetical protein
MEMEDPLAAAASPLVEGERIKVRGFETLQEQRFEPSPYPLPLEGRGDLAILI